MTPEEYFAKERERRRAANTVQRVKEGALPDVKWINTEIGRNGGPRHAWRTAHQGAWREIARAVYLAKPRKRDWQDEMFERQHAWMMG